MTTIKEFRQMTALEINKKIPVAEKALDHLRLKNLIGKVKDPSLIRKSRKEIARMMTVLREKEIMGGKQLSANSNQLTVVS